MADRAARPGPSGLIRRRALVSGRVQGVFFRDHTVREAHRLGVAGTVRNLRDGRVEIVAEGPPDAVDALLRWAHDGPGRATVDDVTVVDEEPTGLSGFDVSWSP